MRGKRTQVTGQRPRLSAIQLRRAIENSGGLWTAEELLRIEVLREGDSRGKLPPGVFINGVTYRCGYDMVEYAEKLGRAHSAEKMSEEINTRLGQTRRHYAERDKVKADRKVGGDDRMRSGGSRRPVSTV